MIPTTSRTSCVACEGKNLETVFELPKLPLTGIYAPKETVTRTDLHADTSFLFCYDCGQGQLSKFIDPELQYGEQYWFRSSTSRTATSGIDFFNRFFDEVTKDRSFHSLLELGCNDLYLLHKIRARATECTGVDSIWKGKEFTDGNLAVRGALDGTERPDLIISEHTFEHLVDPVPMLSRLVDSAVDGALFFIEIPSLECLVKTRRFDQVFHQHLNYFGLASLKRLIHRLGCRYLSHVYNPIYWGALIVAFEKNPPANELPERAPTFETLRVGYSQFLEGISTLRGKISQTTRPIYGFGAAQIAPMLAYYLKTDFSELEAFLDEDDRKVGLKFANLAPEIRSLSRAGNLSEATLLLTALDYRHILAPKVNRLTSRSLLDLLSPS